MGFIIALKFLTIIPVPFIKEADGKTLRKSIPYFPLIGLLLGAILLLLRFIFSFILPAPVIFVLLIIALVLLTGAHHVDGLMDTFDGIVAGRSTKQRLQIMEDSKVGSFGITACVLIMLLKFACLNSTSNIIPAILLMPTLSRWMIVSAIFTCPAAKDSGMGFTFKQGITWQKFTIATVLALIISVALLKLQGLILVASLWLISSAIILFFKTRFGGLTGDNYGAVNEIAEVLVLILIMIIQLIRF